MDADTTRAKGALESQLAQVHAGAVDVLVGTQMIAKGHDFRRITLVAAVQPDGDFGHSSRQSCSYLPGLMFIASAIPAKRHHMLHATSKNPIVRGMLMGFMPCGLIYAALLIGLGWAFVRLPGGFLPVDDQGFSVEETAEGDYRIETLVADMVALLDALGIEQAAVVGHDWGAVQAWHLAIWHPHRVSRLAALSVGHPAAYAGGGWRQKLKGWYVLAFCLRGLAEWLIPLGNWRMFRRMRADPAEAAATVARYARPGRLTAGLNYYRANARSFLWRPDKGRVAMPVLGLYSDGDRFLTAEQMQNSAAYADGSFRYGCITGVNHWLQQEAPEQVNAELLAFLAGA